ncbi:MAG TPA: ATP-binding protein [Candidatus Limnocylindrales bacterium]|nr:ATP-binding protein [Candidatus Limnocylindrales bacterium]
MAIATRRARWSGILALSLAAYTVAAALYPGLRLSIDGPAAELLVGLGGAFLLAAVFGTAVTAYVLLEIPSAIGIAAAFLVLTITSAPRAVVLAAPAAAASLGLEPALADSSQAVALGVASACIAVGVLTVRPEAIPRMAAVTAIVAPTAIVVVGIVVAVAVHTIGQSTIVNLAATTAAATPVAIVVLVASVLGACAVTARAALRQRNTAGIVLACAILIAALALVQFAVFADPTVSRVTSRDLLVAAFAIVAGVGLAIAVRDSLGDDAEHPERALGIARAVRAERSRVAREMHDGLAQEVWLATLRMEEVTHAHSVQEASNAAASAGVALHRALADTRERIMELRAPNGDLDAMLREAAASFERHHGVATEVDLGAPGAELGTSGTEVARIVGEAFINIRKHAHATRVRVQTRPHGSGVRVQIADNGVGLQSRGSGVGLDSMRERAGLVGAAVHWESGPAAGTTVVIDLPGDMAATG